MWNAGENIGVFLTVAFLLDQLRALGGGHAILRTRHPVAALTAGSICALAAIGLVARGHSMSREQSSKLTAATAPNILKEFAAEVPVAMHTSRPILLGSRNPVGPSRVCNPARTGQVKDTVPVNPGDLNGGPGTTIATLYYFDRQHIKSPGQDFNWHQSRLKRYLEK